jgi:KDO2-lipid IV(A) lauroyltransferase
VATSKNKRIKHLIEFAFVWSAFAWANVLPASWAVAIGGALGRIAYAAWGRRRRIAQANLRFCFPDAGDDWIDDVARKSFANFGRAMIDYMRLPRLNARNVEKYHKLVNAASFDEALARGKGAILFTGHFGSWEQTGAAVCLRGYSISFLVGEQHNKYVDNLMNKLRADAGIGIIHMGAAAKGVFRALRGNGMVALLSDQDAGAEGAEVTFFGRRASTPKGPAAFVAKTGAAICAGFTIRDSNSHNTLIMEDAVVPEITGDLEADIAALTQAYTDVLEKYCREYPDHYYWMHRRFKSTHPEIYEDPSPHARGSGAG